MDGKEKAKAWRKAHPEKMRDKQRKYRKKYPDRVRAQQNKACRQLREEVIEILGGTCVRCGCKVSELLEIHHTVLDGHRENKGRRSLLCAIKNGSRSIEDLELRCILCHKLVHGKLLLPKSKGGWIFKWK